MVQFTKMKWIRLFILFCIVNCSACAAPVRDEPVLGAGEIRKTIYLVSHGWHAGIVLRRVDILGSSWPGIEGFPDAHYLEVGWGDMDFYQTPDPHPGIYLKAALLPSSSVLHVVGFNDPVPIYFPYSQIIEIELSSGDFKLLVQTIETSFTRDEAGKAIPHDPGLYGNSRFYLSSETYHIFNTCNIWTARVLNSAGLPIVPACAIRVENLMTQARKFGVVVQSNP